MLLHILKKKVKKPTIVSKYTMHMTKENGVNSGVVFFFAQSKCNNDYENIQHILQFLFKIQNKQMILNNFLRLVSISCSSHF
jgi:hypothetical protein